MTIQPDISIIIPIFNAEQYIATCIESLLMQDELSMEILIVDDSSTDNSREIILAYAHKYPFIKLLANKRTKGESGARNTALGCMMGETCFFLDGDDLVYPNSLKPFIAFMKDNNAVLARGKLSHFCHQRWIYTEDPKFNNLYEDYYPSGSFAQYIYSTKFLKENNILFPEDLNAANDRVFFCKCFCHVSDVPFLKQDVYIYRINHKKIAYDSAKYVLSFVRHFQYIHNYLEEHNKLNFYPSYLQKQFSYDSLRNTYYAVQEGKETADTYMKICIEILLGNKDLLEAQFSQWLGESSDIFWQACERQDSEAMINVLQTANILIPHTTYLGIKESQVQKNWFFLRFLHRLKNMLQTPEDLKNMLYIFRLEQKAKRVYNIKQSVK